LHRNDVDDERFDDDKEDIVVEEPTLLLVNDEKSIKNEVDVSETEQNEDSPRPMVRHYNSGFLRI